MLALHAFRLLFLRTRVSARRKWWILGLGWFFVVFVVSIGPLGIQNMNTRGPYFGPAGFWYATCCTSQCAANA
jgi:quinol-cytochrome oxidoreductase complex cytochrome b subunit